MEHHDAADLAPTPRPPILRRLFASTALVAVAAAASTSESRPTAPETLAGEMAAHAVAFLEGLDQSARGEATTRYDDAERRTWQFGPVPREGIALSKMSAADFERLETLLDTALSPKGMEAWHQIRVLESELRRRESTPEKPALHRDPDLYWLRVYGTPGADRAWSWRFEGHHIALHVSCKPGKTPTTTPFFLGASPLFVDDTATPTRELVPAVDAFAALNGALTAFVATLDEAQNSASLPEISQPKDIRMGPGVNDLPKALGLDARTLDAEGRSALQALIREYDSYLDEPLRATSLDAGMGDEGDVGVRFVRWGSTSIDGVRAWAIRTPSYILELATTSGPDHIHIVLRDTKRDFGGPIADK